VHIYERSSDTGQNKTAIASLRIERFVNVRWIHHEEQYRLGSDTRYTEEYRKVTSSFLRNV